jgi:hypothetical protein
VAAKLKRWDLRIVRRRALTSLSLALLLVFGIVVVRGTTPARADSGLLTLQHVATLVDDASRSTGSARTALITEAVADLEADPELSDEWLREPLVANPPNFPDARARLAAATDALRAPSRPPVEDARAILARVLDDPRFHPRTWLDLIPKFLVPAALLASAIVQFIWSVVRWPFDRLYDLWRLALNSPLFGPVMAMGALAVVVGLIALYRVGLRSTLVSQAETKAPSSRDTPPTGAVALAEARLSASTGQYREACHFLLLATLLWLDEAGLARFDRTATNREQVAHLASVGGAVDGRLIEALRLVVRRFDRIWYGQPMATDADYEELLVLASRVRDALS